MILFTHLPDIIARLGNKVIVIDVQIVGEQVDMDSAHFIKKEKYSEPAFIAALGRTSTDCSVTNCTLNWRGVWSAASYNELKDLRIVSSTNYKLYSI